MVIQHYCHIIDRDFLFLLILFLTLEAHIRTTSTILQGANETLPPKRILIMRNELHYPENVDQEASQIWNLRSKSEYS